MSAGSVRSTRTVATLLLATPSGCATNKMTSSGRGEILFEFVVRANVVKATAIDAATGIEASIVGPAGAGREVLAQAAVRKLRYLLDKKKS